MWANERKQNSVWREFARRVYRVNVRSITAGSENVVLSGRRETKILKPFESGESAQKKTFTVVEAREPGACKSLRASSFSQELVAANPVDCLSRSPFYPSTHLYQSISEIRAYVSI